MRIAQRLTLLSLLFGSLTHCDGSTTCDTCTATAKGLTMFAPAHAPASACVPVQIVTGDGTSPARFDGSARIELEGKASWSTSASCSLSAKTVTAESGSRGAIAYLRAGEAGSLTPIAALDALRANATVVVDTPAADASALVLEGARFVDAGQCAPFWVGSVNAAGKAATAPGGVDVKLAGVSGTQVFGDEGCTRRVETTHVDTAGQALFVRFALPITGALTASAAGLKSATLPVDIQGSAAARLSFVPNETETSTQAGVCTAISLAVVDVTGAPLTVDNATLTVTVAGEAAVFADSGCTESAEAVALLGTSSATVYVLGTHAGSVTVELGLDGATIQKTVSVTSGPPAAIEITGATRLTATGCYAQTATVLDAYGNPALGTSQSLALTGAAVSIFSDAACAMVSNRVTASADNASATFWVKGAAPAASASLTASAGGIGSTTRQLAIVGAPVGLVIVAPATARAGECVAADVRAVDAEGMRADVLQRERPMFATGSVNLGVFGDSGCATAATQVNIPALQDHGTVYVRTTKPAAYTLNATGQNLANASPVSLVVSAGLPSVIVASMPALANVAACVKSTLKLKDAFGNATPADTARALSFTTSGAGSFFADSGCTSPTTSRSFAAGATELLVFYSSAVIETATLTAAGSGLASSTSTLATDVLANRVVADVTNAPLTRHIEIDPSTPTTMWRTLTNDTNWLSTDSGATWRLRCSSYVSSSFYYGTLQVSPAADHTAYVTVHTQAMRLDDLAGAACPNITSAIGTTYGYNEISSFTIGENGTVYGWAGSPYGLNRSTDRGATWTKIYTDTASTALMGFMATSPGAGTIKLVDRAFSGSGNGLYRSTDGGSTFTFVTAAGFNDSSNRLRFDPAHTGWVYKNGLHSEDSGLTWATYPANSLSWTIDSTGAAYRFDRATAASTIVQKAPDARTPVYTTLATIAEPFSNDFTHVSVTPDGTRIAVQTNGSVYLSVNAGVTFSRVPTPNDPAAYNSLSAIAVDDNVAFAVSAGWLLFATTDGGVTWNYRVAGDSGNPPFVHTNPSFPQAAYVRSENFSANYDPHLIGTQDAFVTPVKNPAGAANGWALIGAVSLSDPKAFFTLAANACLRTLDGGQTTTTFNCAFPSTNAPSPIAWMNPTNSNVVWFVGPKNNSASAWTLNAYDAASNATTDLTGSLGLTTAPAAIEMYQTGGNAYVVRVAGSDGSLVSSTNLAASFGPASAAAGDGNCTKRIVTSLASDHRVVATGCVGQQAYAVSKNSGATWKVVRPAGCAVRQLSLTSGASIATCNDGPSKATLL